MILISWFVVLLVENCRIPFDDPNTHLELTMIHEVMVLDHSGPAFGLILYGAAMKLFVFAALIVRLAVPVQSGYAIVDWGVFLVGTVVGGDRDRHRRVGDGASAGCHRFPAC